MAIEFKSSQRFASLGNLRRMACASQGLIHIPKDLADLNPRLFCVHHQLVFFEEMPKDAHVERYLRYHGWKKSKKLPWMVETLQTFNGIHHLSTDAGFLPSTVWFCSHLSNSHPRLQKQSQKVPPLIHPDSHV